MYFYLYDLKCAQGQIYPYVWQTVAKTALGLSFALIKYKTKKQKRNFHKHAFKTNVFFKYNLYLWVCNFFYPSDPHHWLQFINLNDTYLITYLLNYSMKQSLFWEANQFLASQEIPCILWNPNVHYRIHKLPLPIPLLSQINPFQASPIHFLKIYFNIIFPSMPGSFKGFLSLRFPHQNPVCTCPLPPYVLHAPPTSLFSILSPERYWENSTDH